MAIESYPTVRMMCEAKYLGSSSEEEGQKCLYLVG